MWILAFVIFAGLKILTWCCRSREHASLWRHFAYLFAWPGLDADGFLFGRQSPAGPPRITEWLLAIAKMFLGATIIGMIWLHLPDENALLRGWAGMIGLALLLHFGLFHLLSCLWRAIGVPSRPLMDNPIGATSVSTFWSRRWNSAFRDVTHRFLFRPLAKPFGVSVALLLGFLVSGLVHELVISVPAAGGYGGPTLYFLIQAAGIGIERHAFNGGVAGWLFTVLVVVGPAFLLFHPSFVRDVVVPFLDAISLNGPPG